MDRKIVQLLIKNTSFNKIAKQLKVSKKRIRQINDMAEEEGYFNETPLPPYPEAIFKYPEKVVNRPVSEADTELLKKYDWIKERREAGWHLITIWEELDIEVTQASFYRFIKRHKLDENKERGRCRIKVIPEIIHSPGEALLLDWGKLKDVIDPVTGKKRTVWFLAGIMGFSRYLMVRLVWDNKTTTTLKAIESMFNEMGGVPERIISDNPKCFSIEASKYEPILNPAFERFCEHYNVFPEILSPYDPKKKGKVERIVPYVRRLFEAHGDWISLEASQKYIDNKMLIANQRKHGTTKLRPVDVFLTQEAEKLFSLPNTSFELEEYHYGDVRKDGHLRFRGKYYSVGKENYKEKAFIIGNQDTVKIYIKGKLVETHERIRSSYQSKSTKEHHKEPHERIMSNSEHYIKQAQKLGNNVEELVKRILLKGNGFVDTRKIWGILSLDKKYSKAVIDSACKDALECGELGYRGVMSFINLTPPKEIKSSSKNKFTRDTKDYCTNLLQ
jgi:hypothetical protein